VADEKFCFSCSVSSLSSYIKGYQLQHERLPHQGIPLEAWIPSYPAAAEAPITTTGSIRRGGWEAFVEVPLSKGL
jgi:hypothetical protein